MRAAVLLCALLWSLVDSQTEFPYVSFRGVNLLNHSYVDLSLVGDPETNTSSGDGVQCHTDIQACCSSDEGGITSASWYFPDGVFVPFSFRSTDIHTRRTVQRVELRRRRNALSPSGIYCCDIMVDGDDNIRERERVYVGIYGSGGVVDVQSVKFTLDDVASPQFTLTCISTGGPATTVTWTRGSQTAVGERRSDVVNGTTAQYANTLTVTGRLGGLYRCTVANDKPSSDSANFIVQVASAPNNVMAVQEGPTSIRVTWSSGANGYIIFYDNGTGSAIVTVDGGSTDSHTLTGLQNGATYTISIAATAQHLPSEVIEHVIMLVPLPHNATVDTETAELGPTSISLSWTVPDDSVVTGSLVMWELASSGGSSARAVRDDGSGSSGLIRGTSYTITGLRSSTSYLITVILINPAGNSSMQVTLSTTEGSNSGAETDTAAVIGGVVATVLISSISLIVIVIVVLVLRSHRGQYTTGPSKRETMPPPGATNTMELSKVSREPTYIDPDVIRISSNEAYHTVSQTGGTTTDYETVSSGPHIIPPSISTAGDY